MNEPKEVNESRRIKKSEYHDEIVEWIRENVEEIKSKSNEISAYCLKSYPENDLNIYISQGEMVKAMDDAGFITYSYNGQVFDEKYWWSDYPYYHISKKSRMYKSHPLGPGNKVEINDRKFKVPLEIKTGFDLEINADSKKEAEEKAINIAMKYVNTIKKFINRVYITDFEFNSQTEWAEFTLGKIVEIYDETF